MGPNPLQPHRLQKFQAGIQAIDSRYIRGAGLKAVRHEVGLKLQIRPAPGPAGGQGRYPFSEGRVQKNRPHPARAEKALVAGDHQGGKAQGRHIDVQMPRRLGAVCHQRYAAGPAKLRHPGQVLYHAAEV